MTAPLYLDWNAGAPLHPEAQAALVAALALTGNASSVHRFGRTVRSLVEGAREQVAALVGAKPADVIFTAGATEANNQALRAFDRGVAVSAIEHPSVLAVRAEAVVLPVGADGALDLEATARILAEQRPALVAVMLANNETGVIQPVADVARMARAQGCWLHCDAVQAAGRIGFDIESLGADSLALSAHKIGGPQGVGALVMAPGRAMLPLLRGGGQERRRRAGTEPVALIAGFGAAAALAAIPVDLSPLRDRLQTALLAAVPGVVVAGAGSARLGNTLCLIHPSLPADMQVMALDLAGFAVSAGAACSSGKVAASPALLAMGFDRAEAGRAIRVSFGPATDPAGLDRFAAAYAALGRG